jgi:hypothetical protein
MMYRSNTIGLMSSRLNHIFNIPWLHALSVVVDCIGSMASGDRFNSSAAPRLNIIGLMVYRLDSTLVELSRLDGARMPSVQ